MDLLNRLELLLKKVELIDFKYRKLKEISDKSNFNIFTILRKDNDEVNLHSKFIFELLNPSGSHAQRDRFLKSFLKSVGLDSFLVDEYKVYRERFNIDILIFSKKRAIIIENKIDSKEHSNQLERYFKKVQELGYKSDNIKILYLTLNQDSIDSSFKEVKGVIENITYESEIIRWLNEIIEFSARVPTLRETLIQYLNLIEKLTYRVGKDKGFILEIKDFLLEGDNLKTIISIQPAVIEAKIEIQLRFWRSLIENLKSRGYHFSFYNINGDSSLVSSVRRYYTKKKSNRDYGFELKISKNLYFFIEVRKNLYYGFYFQYDEVDSELLDILKSLDISWEEPFWRYPKERLNFEEFNSNVLKFVDREYLLSYVEEITNEIVEVIESFKRNLERR